MSTENGLPLDPENNPPGAGLIAWAVKRWPKRWRGLDDEKKDAIVGSLDRARAKGDGLLESDDAETAVAGGGLVVSASRALIKIEAQNQADELARQVKQVHRTEDVRILITDASNGDRPGTADDIRRAIVAPEAAPAPVRGLPEPGGERGGEGGPAGRQDAP